MPGKNVGNLQAKMVVVSLDIRKFALPRLGHDHEHIGIGVFQKCKQRILTSHLLTEAHCLHFTSLSLVRKA